MDAELKTLDPISVVGMDHVGSYAGIGEKFGALFGMAMSQGWPIQGTLGIYFSDPREVPEAELRSTACVVVPAGFDPGAEGVRTFVVEGGEYAVLRHVGSYTGLGDAWMRMYSEELPRLGRDDCGPPYEIYRNSPMEVPEDQLITDIHVPVKAL
jgi:AraC family transcriptional regulator